MKLPDYARKLGIGYRTAWNMYKRGEIPGAYQLPSGTIIVPEEATTGLPDKVAIYARVSSGENKNTLDRQAKRLEEYCMARGYRISKVVKEVGSGIDDNRGKLEKLVTDKSYNRLVVEHKDRLTRFGFNYLKLLADEQGKTIEVVNEAGGDTDDLMA
ncbi:MAG: IS607 family transposase, partial [Actinobacteria bacterium]|nr:IS607 family transposase [Actinomycetota bacterium]